MTELNELVHLDISDDKEESQLYDILTPGARFKVSALLQKYESLPNLHSFDISGQGQSHILQVTPHFLFLLLPLPPLTSRGRKRYEKGVYEKNVFFVVAFIVMGGGGGGGKHHFRG